MSRIASVVGNPLMADKFTANQKRWIVKWKKAENEGRIVRDITLEESKGDKSHKNLITPAQSPDHVFSNKEGCTRVLRRKSSNQSHASVASEMVLRNPITERLAMITDDEDAPFDGLVEG